MKTIIIDGIEYNLTPKVLFKKGDFVVIQETTYLISKIEGLNITLSCNGRDCLFDIDVLKNARLWDITKDAKDGDVLAYDDSKCIALFKNIYDEDSFNSYGFVGGCTGTFESRQSYHDIEGAHPATKEQRDLLFQKIHEAGYEWDADKKELIKIEHNPYLSEKDNEHVNSLLKRLDGLCRKEFTTTRFAINDDEDWLKSLKDKYTWKPSDEQMEALKDALNDAIWQYDYKGSMIKEEVTRKHAEIIESLYNDLKKIKGE